MLVVGVFLCVSDNTYLPFLYTQKNLEKLFFYKLKKKKLWNMSYVNNVSYVSNMSYVNNMSYVCRLYELYELCKSYEYFYESLKITWNYKNENIERKYLKNMRKNQFLTVKNSLLE